MLADGIDAQRVDFIAVPVQDRERWCYGVGVSDPARNRILLHHRYAPYPDGSLP